MTSSVMELLAGAGRAAPSADNSQPWCLVWDGACLNVQFRQAGPAGLSPPPTDIATLVAIGGVIENIVQMGAHLGLDLHPETGLTPPPGTPSYARIPVETNRDVPDPCPDHPLFSRHTNRFAYRPTALPAALKSEMLAQSEGSARIQLFDEPGAIRSIADLVKAASRVRFRVEEAHVWLAGSLRFDSVNGDGTGLDVHSLDLPPGGALLLRLIESWRVMSALNRLGVYRFMAATDAAPVYAAPALVAITASNDQSGAIEAGRLLNRVWIQLNEHNVAVHPYYAITDQLARLRANTLPDNLRIEALQIEEGCACHCALSEGESLYMILRVGYPQKPAPRSKRVPLAQVFRDLTANAPPHQ